MFWFRLLIHWHFELGWPQFECIPIPNEETWLHSYDIPPIKLNELVIIPQCESNLQTFITSNPGSTHHNLPEFLLSLIDFNHYHNHIQLLPSWMWTSHQLIHSVLNLLLFNQFNYGLPRHLDLQLILISISLEVLNAICALQLQLIE